MASKKELNDAIDVLLNHMNLLSSDIKLSDTICGKMRTEHRTIQQCFIKEINNFLVKYSDFEYDGRNEASVKFAKHIKDQEFYFPMI